MLRDNGYATSADVINVYIGTAYNAATTTITNSTLLATVNRSNTLSPAVTVPASGYQWYQYTVMIPATYNTATNYIIFRCTSAFGNDTHIDDVNVIGFAPCTGQPAATTYSSAALSSPVCPNTTVTINATDPNQPISGIQYQWQQSSSATGPWTNASGTGTTTLSLTTAPLVTTTYYRLRDSCVNSQMATYSTVYTVPVALAQVTQVIPGFHCASGTDTLRALGTGTNFRWYAAATGGSVLATGSYYVTPQISAATVFYVSSTNASCESARVPDTAFIRTPPPAVITPSSSPVFCAGGSVVLNANAAPAGTTYSYTWQFNTVNNGVTTIKDTASNTGSYTVIVRDNNTTCATISAPLATTAGSPPPSAISPAGAVGVCPNGCTRLATYSAPGLLYQWYYNGSPITGATDSAYCATNPGMYTVKVSTLTGNCFSITPVPDSLYAYASPAIAISAPNTTICQGSSLTLSAAPTTGLSYQWQNNGVAAGGTSTATTYAATTAGSYTVKATDIRGCTAVSNALPLTVTQLPPAIVSPALGSRGCDSVVLTANGGSGAFFYQWKRFGTNIAGATGAVYSARVTGTYTVSVTNGAGCVATSAVVSDTVKLSPASTITYFSPLTFCQGSAVVLNIYSVTGTRYQWRKDTVAIAGVTSLSYIASTSGLYEVLVTDTVTGCSRASLPVVVQVNAAPTPVVVPYNGALTTTTPYQFYQWLYNSQVIVSNSSHGGNYSPDRNGAYSVTVVDSNGCTATSDVYFVNGLGVSGISPAQVQVYPNPVSEVVNVKAPGLVRAMVRDMTGRDVAGLEAGTAAGREVRVNVSGLASGMYLLIISDEKGNVIRTDKLVKQ